MKFITLRYDRNTTAPIRVTLPTSKSMAARALIIAALAGVKPEKLGELPVCSDTIELTAAIDSTFDGSGSPDKRFKNTSPIPACLHLNLGLGGTSLRFFTAFAASLPGVEFEIDCAAPLKKRPLAPLCEALITAGAEIKYLETAGYPPLFIKGQRMPGGKREISAAISSQFVSAMIMCAPYWEDGLELHLTGEEPVSVPYIDMTLRMMRRAGASAKFNSTENIIKVVPLPYQTDLVSLLTPEADWSAASYFYELALILPEREVEISSLTPQERSLQGDSRCAEIFSLFGVSTDYHPDGRATLRCDKELRDKRASESKINPFPLDMSNTPDLVPALAVALCLAGIRYRITGIGHLRLKESDRISALQIELGKIGFSVKAGEDYMEWKGGIAPTGENENIETYHDHRIAMAFAPAASRFPYLTILDPKVTEKSFPDYFRVLKKAGFSL